MSLNNIKNSPKKKKFGQNVCVKQFVGVFAKYLCKKEEEGFYVKIY